jgi:hypothetical protein
MTAPEAVPAGATLVWAWLHLSDIHAGHGNAAWRADQKIVLDRLVDDVRRLVAESRVPVPDAILVTGDIAFSGNARDPHEYDRAAAWLDACRDAVGTPTVVYSVPGNHDVVRTDSEHDPGLWRLVRDTREPRDDADGLDERLADHADRAALASRLVGYHAFAAAHGNPAQEPHGGWQYDIATNAGITIHLVGWNTALLSNDDQDKGKLRIAKQTVAETLPAGRLADRVIVVLTHHPIDDCETKNADELSAYLHAVADVHLHGHVHNPRTEIRRSGDGGELVTVVAGAVHAEDDSPLVAHGYSFGALYRDDDGRYYVAVWPRRWMDAEFRTDQRSLPDGEVAATHVLAAARQAPTRPRGGGVTARLAAALAQRLGQRRTAFPTDLSIAQLRDRELLVQAPLTSAAGDPATPADLADGLAAARGALVLGAPGSGKSVLAYTVARDLIERGGRAPLPIDLDAVLAKPPASRAELLTVAALLADVPTAEAAADDAPLAIIVDGVDEALVASEPDDIGRALRQLARHGPLLVTCRSDDYERNRAAVPTELFDDILEMPVWSPEHEFAEFSRRLFEQRLLENPNLPDLVRTDPALRALVERPLFARMLTFVADVAGGVHDRTSLYERYISRSAAVTDDALARARCDTRTPAAELWRDAAWYAFVGYGAPDRIPLADLVARLHDERGLDRDCAYRALAGIVDPVPAAGTLLAAFLHYSFYEFLVAQRVALALVVAQRANDADAAADALRRDLPPEIRRHLTALLRTVAADVYAWPRWLAGVYRAFCDSDDAQRRVIGNLIAYIAARLDVPAADELRELLTVEDDPFLRNSLSWALARLDETAADDYVAALADDSELASLNRGYLLYYYGDLPRHHPPPYRDDDPHPAWPQTRDRLLAKHQREPTAPASRQAVDLYTWFDLLAVRDEHLTRPEAEAADGALSRIAIAGLPEDAVATVRRLRDQVAPR